MRHSGCRRAGMTSPDPVHRPSLRWLVGLAGIAVVVAVVCSQRRAAKEESISRIQESISRTAASIGTFDAKLGRSVFERHCGCHIGSSVGPDLRAVVERARSDTLALRFMVESIVDPSRVVRARLEGTQFYMPQMALSEAEIGGVVQYLIDPATHVPSSGAGW